MKKQLVKVTILPVENGGDAGSKGKFKVKAVKKLPKEMPTGDAGSKGIFHGK